MKARPQPALTMRLDVWNKDVVLALDRATYISLVNSYEPGSIEAADIKGALGLCDYLESAKKPIVIGWFDRDVGTLVHECVHAAAAVLDDKGVPISRKNDEAFAYTVEFLFSTLRKVKRPAVIRTRPAS